MKFVCLCLQVVESCKVGYRKPHPKIYEIVLKELGVPGERCVFLDDIGANLKAAQKFGIKTIKVAWHSRVEPVILKLIQFAVKSLIIFECLTFT